MKFLQKLFSFFSSQQIELFHSALQRTLRDSVTHRKILAPFFHSVACSSLVYLFLFFFFLFLSVLFFLLLIKVAFRYVFTKTIILLGLAEYEIIITNLSLRTSLVINIISYSARPRIIIVNYYNMRQHSVIKIFRMCNNIKLTRSCHPLILLRWAYEFACTSEG